MISKIINFYESNKTIFKIWFIYTIVINTIPFLIYFLGFPVKIEYNFENYFFKIWGDMWDGGNYLKISQVGYSYPLQAFFPGYPLILSFLSNIIPTNFVLKINLLLTLPMLFQLFKLLKNLGFEDKPSYKALIGFLLLPSAFFFQANYVETIYILISAWGLNSLISKKYYQALISGIFLSTIKISSFIFSFILFIKLYKDQKIKIYESLKIFKLIAFASITLIGIIIYFTYLHHYFNDFWYFFIAQKYWLRLDSSNLFITIENLHLLNAFSKISEIFTLVIGVILILKTYKKFNPYLYIFSIFHFILPICTGSLLSLNRLFLYCYPMILFGLASHYIKNKLSYYLTLGIVFILQFIGIILLLNEHFIG
jgi:hypothetical protein